MYQWYLQTTEHEMCSKILFVYVPFFALRFLFRFFSFFSFFWLVPALLVIIFYSHPLRVAFPLSQSATLTHFRMVYRKGQQQQTKKRSTIPSSYFMSRHVLCERQTWYTFSILCVFAVVVVPDLNLMWCVVEMRRKEIERETMIYVIQFE